MSDRYIERECKTHGVTRYVLERRGYYRCLQCRKERVAAQRRKMKQALVNEAGGRCQLCGYCNCVAALDFHHLDPKLKKFPLSLRGITKAYSILRQEARKCVLLCANCHREVERGFVSCEGLSSLIPEDQPYGTPGKRERTEEVVVLKPRLTKIDWPDIEVLRDQVAESSYSAVGRVLGVSDNAVRKRIQSRMV